MSESGAKNVRRMIDRELAKKTKWLVDTFVENMKSYPLKYRLKFAWKIVRGRGRRNKWKRKRLYINLLTLNKSGSFLCAVNIYNSNNSNWIILTLLFSTNVLYKNSHNSHSHCRPSLVQWAGPLHFGQSIVSRRTS